MIDAPAPADEARSPQRSVATNGHRWLHTLELGLVFLVLAMLADLAGLAHDESAALAGQRASSGTAKPVLGATLFNGRAMVVAARPAAPH